MMRSFQIGTGSDHKVVRLEVQDIWLRVTKERADGTSKFEVKEFSDTTRAQAASDQAARQLLAHGYRERGVAPPSSNPAPTPQPRRVAPASPSALELDFLAEGAEGDTDTEAAHLPRLAPAATATLQATKTKAKKKKRKKKANQRGDALDRRVIAAIGAFGLACLAMVGFLGYKAFLEPPSIIGNWQGSRTEHEIGKFLTNTQYSLILDEQHRASMGIEESPPSVGTYTLRGDRLLLAFKNDEGEPYEVQYKVVLGGATLDLHDVESGKKLVQLIRFHTPATVGGGKPTAPAPQALVAGPADPAADAKLASVPFAAQDQAFALRHPPGWAEETGARADNSYSWVRYTKGNATIKVDADVAGSLLAGPNSNDDESGSETAPVHGAHERYKKIAAERFGSYEESPPAPFPGSGLGEGRIATYMATGSGVFGTKLRGIRVTFLSNDRRISILCDAPVASFDALLPTFLATCRSLGR